MFNALGSEDSGRTWKTGFTQSLPPQHTEAVRTAESHFQSSVWQHSDKHSCVLEDVQGIWTAKETETNEATEKKQWPARHLEEAHPELPEIASNCWAACRLCCVVQVSNFHEMSSGWSGFLVRGYHWVISAPVNNPWPNKTHWFTKMNSGGILTLVCLLPPTWGEKTTVHISPGRVSHNSWLQLCFHGDFKAHKLIKVAHANIGLWIVTHGGEL